MLCTGLWLGTLTVIAEMGVGGVFEGYRYASFSEINNLWDGGHYRDQGDSSGLPEVKRIMNILRPTRTYFPSIPELTYGEQITAFVGEGGGFGGAWEYTLYHDPLGLRASDMTDRYTAYSSLRHNQIASYLVSTTVPEPSSILLMMLGLAGVASRKVYFSS